MAILGHKQCLINITRTLSLELVQLLLHTQRIFILSDMEKFPVRMKDNDLLVTQMFEDPLKEPITALSIFMPPNSCE